MASASVKSLLGCLEFSHTVCQKTILLVDPDERFRGSLAGHLTEKGFEVWGADSLASCFTTVAARRPALVASELRLSDGSGLEILSVLKSKGTGSAVAIITGYGSIATAVRAVRWGAAGYWAKPVTADQIVSVLCQKPCVCSDEGLPLDLGLEDDLASLTLDRAVWEYVNQVIEAAGSIGGAARRLGVDRRNLRRMLAKYPPMERTGTPDSLGQLRRTR